MIEYYEDPNEFDGDLGKIFLMKTKKIEIEKDDEKIVDVADFIAL